MAHAGGLHSLGGSQLPQQLDPQESWTRLTQLRDLTVRQLDVHTAPLVQRLSALTRRVITQPTGLGAVFASNVHHLPAGLQEVFLMKPFGGRVGPIRARHKVGACFGGYRVPWATVHVQSSWCVSVAEGMDTMAKLSQTDPWHAAPCNGFTF